MRIQIGPSEAVVHGPKDSLNLIHDLFKFRDRAAESDLRRFLKTSHFKERALVQSEGELPDWYKKWKEEKQKEMRSKIVVHCTRFEAEALIVPTGLIHRLTQHFTDQNISFDISDTRNFDLDRRILTGEKPRKLRKPQIEPLEIVFSERVPTQKGLGVFRIATGVGKTLFAQELIRKLGHRAIFLVPSINIMNQTAKRFETAFGKKNVRVYGDGKKDIGYVTVATYQSVYRGDPEEFKDIAVVIGDEAHHDAADSIYGPLMNHFKNAVYRFGLTAYEERADGATLLIESAFGPVVYSYDAAQAIDDGYLAKPTFMIYEVIRTKGRWTKYKTVKNKRTPIREMTSTEYNGDDPLVSYRNWFLGNDYLNDFIANVIVKTFNEDGKSVLILVDEKEHGERLQARIPHAGFAVGGEDNDPLLRDFNARKLKCLIGTSTIGEGTDTIPVDVLVNLLGGASKSQTLQANGRALRNEEDDNGVTRKPTCLIIDFDFPNCRILSRHSSIREKIHRTLGEIHRGRL